MVATVHPIRRRRFHGHHDADAAARELEEAQAQRDAEQQRIRARREALYVSGRLLIGFVFIVSALAKAFSFRDLTADGGGVVLWAAIAVELIAGTLLALGLQARRAATVLLTWLAIATLFFHGDLANESDRALALANLAMCGALLAFIAHGGGLLSVDRMRTGSTSD
jgi:putative oxidoreductase